MPHPTPSRLALLPALLLLACQSSPPGRPSPLTRRTVPAPRPSPSASPASSPAPAARPSPASSPAPAPTPREPATITIKEQPGDGPRSIVIRGKVFGPDVAGLRPDDLIDVDLSNGGRTRGHVRNITDEVLVLSLEGTSIVTRLTPGEIASVRLIDRAPQRIIPVVAAAPRDDKESLLPEFVERAVLDAAPPQLWDGLCAGNPILRVRRPAALPVADYLRHVGPKAYYSTLPESFSLQPGDELKVVAVVHGVEARPLGDVVLDDVTLLLHRRGGVVQRLCALQPLRASDLEPGDVAAFSAKQPVTFAVFALGSPPELTRILRVPGATARAYMGHVERLPDRVALRRMRAQRSPELAAAEKQVNDFYLRLGISTLKGRPVLVRIVYPMAYGDLRLVRFAKELGLD